MIGTRKAFPILILATITAIGLLLLSQRPAPQTLHFGETGHTVQEPFLSAFRQMGGIATLGYPISEAYTDQRGLLVQYFQNVRLEQTEQGVQMGALGIELGLARQPEQSSDSSGALIYQTGHWLDSAFVTYYDTHQGLDTFGPPIGPNRREGSLLVQDFERVRLIRDPTNQQVRLGNLGSIALTVFPPPDQSIVAAPPNSVRTGDRIKPGLSLEHATLQSDALQTVYIHVVMNDDVPVADAQTIVTLSYEGGASQIEMPPTDQLGISSATFVAPPAPPGTSVTVNAYVVWGDEVATVSTIYLQWW